MISAPPLAARVFRSELVRASLILLALLNIAFFPALWGNRTLMTSAGETASLYITGARPSASPGLIVRTPDPGAPGWQFEPAMAFNGVEMFRHFRLPRWNPYAGYGSPWAAGMMPQPVFPLALIPEAFPGPRAIAWFLVLRLFVAGVFAFLFMRFFVPFAASVVAAVAFMLTGYFVLFLNIDHLSTEVLLSAVFWSFERMFRTPSSRGVVPASAVIFLSIISGMPESTLLVLSFGYAVLYVPDLIRPCGTVKEGVRAARRRKSDRLRDGCVSAAPVRRVPPPWSGHPSAHRRRPGTVFRG